VFEALVAALRGLFDIFANNLMPILLLSAAGYLLGKFFPVDAPSVGRVTFYVLSPILVFNLLTQSQLVLGKIVTMLLFGASCIAIMAAAAYLVGRLMNVPKEALVAIVLTSAFGNSGNYGLPLVSFAFGQEALTYAGIYFVASSLMLNTLGVIIASLGRLSVKDALLAFLKVPAVYAIFLALLIVRLGWTLPVPLERAVSLAAGGAVPMMILLLGLELQRARWDHNHLGVVIVSVFLRLIAAPLTALGLSLPFDLNTTARQLARHSR
jgi:predicted permease